MKEKWKTWWWYHWGHVLLAVAVLAVVLYSFLPGMLEPKPDYGVAVISLDWVSEDTMAALQERFRNALEDADRDGETRVQMNRYQADLSGETAGTVNYSEAARLDADLVGKQSSILLFDNPEGFRKNTAVSTEPVIPCKDLPFFDGLSLPEGMVFTVRSDCDAGAVYERVINDR
ncbi:MAG: hypothetical protein IKS55_09485 [Oscillospiraceae bacterium]|nr:hypothetical protein [Oscillospiraceae bacterium]